MKKQSSHVLNVIVEANLSINEAPASPTQGGVCCFTAECERVTEAHPCSHIDTEQTRMCWLIAEPGG